MEYNQAEKEDLAIFQRQCEYWIKKLSLTDWDFRCTLNNAKDNGNVLLSPDGRKAYIGLCRKREPIVSVEDIAKHECLEILLFDLAYLLQPYYAKEFIDNEVHKVINRLMPVLKEGE